LKIKPQKILQPGWRDRRHESRKINRNGLWVTGLRIVLPALAVGCVIVAVAWPFLVVKEHESSEKLMGKVLRANPKLENKVVQPRFYSLDDQNKPVFVEAQSAIQQDLARTNLETPSGKVQLNEETELAFQAKDGIYWQKENRLELIGDVHLITNTGYDVITQSAHFDLAQNSGYGNEHVHGNGPDGQVIDAEGFKIYKNDGTLHLTGHTKIVLPTQ
jgi:lipopolysaccharide export system protein LptC